MFLRPYLKINMNLVILNDQLFQKEEQIIRDAASSGACVIVGRLSGYFLRKNAYVVKVFINVPFEFRVQNIVKNIS